ncbi:MAG: histidine kinase N-terminal domain-containing protein, partial [Bacilli bacterium]|nr:histidine kinase N-terminal domain-containing protein [Bacilli bacterium]
MPVEKLCRELTGLSDNDIKCIESMANVLQPIANMEAADVFIDCMATNGEALVVAEAKPEGSISSYKDSVVGMMAEERN